LAKILIHIIELPYIVFKRWIFCHQPGDGMPCARDPAIMVNGAVTKHLEVLGRMTVPGFGIIKGINHRGPIEWKLLGAIDHLWKRQADCLQHSRCDIYDMAKLRPD